jgi:alkanesulfonate monooxygenase SsuD/methylene tetrahydromethanopterin reductase-like flavin-dependent oxidoreductase (luciferase family)
MTGPASGIPTTDLLLSPLGADGPGLVEAARIADQLGYGGIWTLDHFSGAMIDRPWSREPFTVLGAMAATTARARIGPLVANAMNRHPVLLSSAAATLQSLSGGRLVLGLGAGAAPGSPYAGEHIAIGARLDDTATRRRRLIETIDVVRLIWEGRGDHDGEFFTLRGLSGVIGNEARPPIIVGASSRGTVDLAVENADGVNVVGGPGWEDLVRHARDRAAGRPFEISVYTLIEPDHPTGGDLDAMADLGVDCRILAVRPPFPTDRLGEIADRLGSL